MMMTARLPAYLLQVYEAACEVISALADRLHAAGGSGRYFFGAKPCSLDALVLGHLMLYRASPVAAPVLHRKVRRQAHISYLAYKCRPPCLSGLAAPLLPDLAAPPDLT